MSKSEYDALDKDQWEKLPRHTSSENSSLKRKSTAEDQTLESHSIPATETKPHSI